jgi:tricorn protease
MLPARMNCTYARAVRWLQLLKNLTSFGKGYGWNLYWSPDSKKIAFIDFEQAIRILTVATGNSIVIDHTKTITFSGFSGFT